MYHLLIAHAALVVHLSLTPPDGVEGRAGQAPRNASILHAVLRFRLTWMGDTTRVDGCRVYIALGRPEGFPRQVEADLRTRLDGPDATCGAPVARPDPWRHIVLVDSLVAQDSTAFAFLTIRKGEYRYQETYRLRPIGAPGEWGVQDVTISRAIRLTIWRGQG